MTKIFRKYFIKKLYIDDKNDGKVLAHFIVDDLFFKLCLFGYTEKEQTIEESDTIFYSDDNFIDFMNEFLEMYRIMLRDYYTMKKENINNVFTVEIEKANTINKIDLLEYKKRIRTSYRIYAI